MNDMSPENQGCGILFVIQINFKENIKTLDYYLLVTGLPSQNVSNAESLYMSFHHAILQRYIIHYEKLKMISQSILLQL